MAYPELQLAATVVASVLANVRQGAPTTAAPVAHKVDAGTSLATIGVVIGESVQNNPFWYHLDAGAYIWAGACKPIQAGPAPAARPAAAVPGSLGGLAVPMVVDLYHGDVVTDFGLAYRSGLRGVIHKASTGGTGRDDLYAQRRQDAAAAGLLWGAYHWGTAAPAQAQVDNFLAAAAPDDATLVALDFETTNGNQMDIGRATEFLELLHQQLGRRPVLYCGALVKSLLGNTTNAFLGQHRLWLAQYGPVAKVQPSWANYWLWQYTDGSAGPGPKSVPGIPGNAAGELDCDYFAGTEDELRAQWAG